MDLTGMLQAAAGAAGGDKLYIEDVFSTYLYTGTGAAQTITNGIDLDGEGGLVWIKSRSAATSNFLFDTERGVTDEINSDSTDAEASLANSLTAFNSDGFAISSATGIGVSAATYASWTFRKAEKFFDVVTYTGTGSAQNISHNLGSVPGAIITKCTSTTSDWVVYHRSPGATKALRLNTTDQQSNSVTWFNNTEPTDSVFTVNTNAQNNTNGATYVAYLFAHDAGGFGDDGLQNVVSCGSYTTPGTTEVNLGWEPQWVLVKPADAADTDWIIFDNMRGFTVNANNATYLRPNLTAAEGTGYNFPIRSTGFIDNMHGAATMIYIAIRRGPMKTPTAGTEVYKAIARTGTGTDATVTGVGFAPDLVMPQIRIAGWYGAVMWDRLRGAPRMIRLNATAAEVTAFTDSLTSFTMDGCVLGSDTQSGAGVVNGIHNYINHFFRRAPGFFDEVCYTGTGSNTTFNHNLGVVPELMIMKKRSATDDWAVYAGDNTDFLLLNTTAATADDNTYWNDTSPTSTVFSVGTNADVNTSAATYVAYLFASVAGVSDIGTYTGNGSSVTVTTGFQPRFILVKRTDSTGNWIYGDSVRGLVAGDDPALFLNTTDAETTGQDWVDISATGFTVNETALNANVSTATYIYLCVS